MDISKIANRLRYCNKCGYHVGAKKKMVAQAYEIKGIKYQSFISKDCCPRCGCVLPEERK